MPEKHIVLCGLGHIGQRILSLLDRLEESVVVVSQNAPDEWEVPDACHFKLIVGDARNDKVLAQTDIANAKAIIIVGDDDMANVSVALDVKRNYPEVYVVVRLSDEQLAQPLAESADFDRVLSTSALAAPSFIAGALGETIRASFDAGGATCLIESITVQSDSEFVGKSLLAISQTGKKISVGDTIVSLSVRDERRGQHIAIGGEKGSFRRFRDFVSGLREWRRESHATLNIILLVLSIIVITSVGLFHYVLGMPVVDALYFVVTIITTVGFGDFNLMGAPVLMKLYGAFLMLCGAALIATLFSIISDLVLSMRLRDLLSKGCSRYRDHIIVAGVGKIGYRVLRELVQSGETVVGVERDEDGAFVETSRSLAPLILGNARTEETLRRAGVAGAKAILALTDDDIANLSIGLAAKRLNPSCRVLLRVFDARLAERLGNSVQADCVLSVSSSAAPAFVASALDSDAVYGFVLSDDSLVSIFQRRSIPDLKRGETPLLWRNPDEDSFKPFTPGSSFDKPIEWIGSRQRQFKK